MEKLYLFLGLILGAFGTWLTISFFYRRKNTGFGDLNLSETDEFIESSIKAESVLIKTSEDSSNAIIMISKAYYLGISGFHSENSKLLGEIETEVEEFNQRAKLLKANTYRVIQKLQQDSIETGH